MKQKTILILEDNERVLIALIKELKRLEKEQGYRFNIVTFPTREEADEYLRIHSDAVFDVILLDRTDAHGVSFQTLDLKRLGLHKIISISSTPRYNEAARALGVKRVALKDYWDIASFAGKVMAEIGKTLRE